LSIKSLGKKYDFYAYIENKGTPWSSKNAKRCNSGQTNNFREQRSISSEEARQRVEFRKGTDWG